MKKMRILIFILVLLWHSNAAGSSAIFIDNILTGNEPEFLNLTYLNTALNGRNPDQYAEAIRWSNASGSNINLALSYPANRSDELSVIKYIQRFKGLDVHSSRIILGIKNGKIVRIKSNYYHEKDISIEPQLGKKDVLNIIEKDIDFNLENSAYVENISLVIYPESTGNEVKYHLSFKVELGLIKPPPSKWIYFIDADTGEILEKYDKVAFNTLSGNVTGRIYLENSKQRPVVRNFWNETLHNYTDHKELGKTDTNGFYNLSGQPDIFTLFAGLTGEFVDVIDENGRDAKHIAVIKTPSIHNINWWKDDTSYKKEQSNIFYHVNVIHDFFTKGSPFDLSVMNYQTKSYVQFPGICGAFSDGTDIYFSGIGGGCDAASLFSDIIYHEYTHNVIDHVYTIHAPAKPYRVESGALNEGLADYFASSINGNRCIAEGLVNDCLRNLNTTYRFTEDITGEAHNDGRIISGSLWDIRDMSGQNITDSLVINAMKLEPFNFSEFLDDIIVADDNNSNLKDGTPHLYEICTAFFKNHGIFSPYCSIYYPVPLRVNLLKNPGFENERANWTEYSNTGQIIKKYLMGTYSGNWIAYMGNYNNAEQYIFQDIAIPSGIEKAYVQFWYWIRSEETTEYANDTMRIEIRKPDNNKLLRSPGKLSNLNESSGYRISEQYDISEFKNRTIRLMLNATTDSSAPTAFIVDDIALIAVYDTNATGRMGSISGMKFNDSNLDGRKNKGEKGLANWTIILKNDSGSIVDTMITDNGGKYIFKSVADGNYTLEELPQAGWRQTFPKSTGKYNITIKNKEKIKGINFGNHLIHPNIALFR